MNLDKGKSAKSILVIDDCKDNLFLMDLLLQSEGYQVRSADSGTKGIAEIKQRVPDLIILDLMMPDISGLEVIQHLKNKCQSRVPIVMLTANSSLRQEDVEGIDALCYKPFNIDRILKLIQSILTFSLAA